MQPAFPALAFRYRNLPAEEPGKDLGFWLLGFRYALFDNYGVIAPLPVPKPDETLKENTFRLELNGKPLAEFSCDGTLLEMATNLLANTQQHLGALICPALVEYYLLKTAVRYPALVEAVRARFNLEGLTVVLSAILDKYRNFQDFAGLLESLLESAADPAS